METGFPTLRRTVQEAPRDQWYSVKGHGDTFLSASGDNGTTSTAKQHKETVTFANPTNGG